MVRKLLEFSRFSLIFFKKVSFSSISLIGIKMKILHTTCYTIKLSTNQLSFVIRVTQMCEKMGMFVSNLAKKTKINCMRIPAKSL